MGVSDPLLAKDRGARNEAHGVEGGMEMRVENWTQAEKAIARRAYDKALDRELAALTQEVKRRAAAIEQPAQIWALEKFIAKRGREINDRYDYRYSVLLMVFANLLLDGLIQEDDLKGLGEDKLRQIFGVVAMARGE
jgi:hypothetical protein